MDIVFEKLFAIKFSHNFYSKNIAADFTAEPTRECVSLMRDYRIVSKKTGSGITALIELKDTQTGTPVVALEDGIKFSFIIFSNNPYLKNFTELALDSVPENIYHFSNLNNNVQNSELLISADKSEEFAGNKDLINLKPQKFYYTQACPNSTALIQIKDFEDKTVVNKAVAVPDDELSYFVDVGSYRPGRYKLLVDGALKLDFYADSSLSGKNIFGIIDIYSSGSVPQAYRFSDINGAVSGKTYSVKFNRRKTTWKYFVVLKFKKTINPDDLSLTYPDASNSFNKEAAISLSDGYTAVPFTSDKEIEFSDTAVKGIQLKKNNGTGGFEIDDIPNASYKNIKPDPDNNKVISEIFIYV